MGLISNKQQTAQKKIAKLYRDVIRREAVLGGTIFGPIPNGARREFFCLDERTWVWHEEWTDHQGNKHIQTTRYDVRPNGIVKCQNNGPYIKVSPAEAKNLAAATKKYQELVTKQILEPLAASKN